MPVHGICPLLAVWGQGFESPRLRQATKVHTRKAIRLRRIRRGYQRLSITSAAGQPNAAGDRNRGISRHS